MSKNKNNIGKALGGLAILSAGIFATMKIIKRKKENQVEIQEETEDNSNYEDENLQDIEEITEKINEDLEEDKENINY